MAERLERNSSLIKQTVISYVVNTSSSTDKAINDDYAIAYFLYLIIVSKYRLDSSRYDYVKFEGWLAFSPFVVAFS
jgi:hypothetical protein